MISRVPTEVLQEIQKEIQKALAANPELPVVFIRDRTNYSKYLDTIYLMPNYVEIGKVLDTTIFEEKGIPYMRGEKLRLYIRDEVEREYGRHFYDDNPDGYMRVFAEKAQKYKNWVEAVIVHRDAI